MRQTLLQRIAAQVNELPGYPELTPDELATKVRLLELHCEMTAQAQLGALQIASERGAP